MYAVIEDGSRQYRVSEGDLVTLDYRDAEKGTRLEFNRVLLYQNGDDTRIGQPVIDGMSVLAEVVDHPSTKVIIQKFRRRKNYRRLKGHRQWYTKVQVKYILLPGAATPSAETPPAPPPAPAASETPAAQTPPPTPPPTGTT
jgi:large subunit ribosomal protein L21